MPYHVLGGCKGRGEGMEGRSEEIGRRRKLEDYMDVEYKSPGKETSLGQLTDQLIFSLPCGSQCFRAMLFGLTLAAGN